MQLLTSFSSLKIEKVLILNVLLTVDGQYNSILKHD